MRASSIVFLLPLIFVACAEESSEERTTTESVSATHSHIPVSACQRDSDLMTAIRSTDYQCPCEATVESQTVQDDACVVAACAGVPDLLAAVCRPDQGYQCAGTLQVPSEECTGVVTEEVDPTCCTARFRYDGDGGCLLTVPLTCQMDGDCPDGTYCSMERGGICWFDCVPTGPSIAGAEVCETCDCNGRCDVPDYRDTPPSRPRVAVDPESVSFDFDPEVPLAPYRFMLSANLPNVQSVDIVVRAPRGFAVACPAGFGLTPPSETAYHQECTSTHDLKVTKGIWIRPIMPIPQSLDHGSEVTFSWPGSGLAPIATLPLYVNRAEAPTTPRRGWYRGTATVSSANVIEEPAGGTPVEDFSALVLGGASVSQVGFEVLAHYLPEFDSTRVVLVDDARLLGPDGVIVLDFDGTIESEGALGSPTVSKVPFIGGTGSASSEQSPERGRLRMGSADGANHAGFATESQDRFLEASEDGKTLTLVFGLLAEPETHASATRFAGLRVSVDLTRDRSITRPVPSEPEEPEPVSAIKNGWRTLIGQTTGPSTWEMVSSRWPVPAPEVKALHSIASCLHSEKAEVDLFGSACFHFLRQGPRPPALGVGRDAECA